jgi:hypothetical protein
MAGAPRAREAQERHDRMVALVAAQYRERGFAVAAELPGFPPPEPVEGLVPDLVARKEGETVVVEVETRDTLFSEEYKGEHKAFRKWKEQSPKERDYKMVLA